MKRENGKGCVRRLQGNRKNPGRSSFLMEFQGRELPLELFVISWMQNSF